MALVNSTSTYLSQAQTAVANSSAISSHSCVTFDFCVSLVVDDANALLPPKRVLDVCYTITDGWNDKFLAKKKLRYIRISRKIAEKHTHGDRQNIHVLSFHCAHRQNTHQLENISTFSMSIHFHFYMAWHGAAHMSPTTQFFGRYSFEGKKLLYIESKWVFVIFALWWQRDTTTAPQYKP